ncbi:MAG: transporter substrate-binding domain-containing protein [Clostridia bacterium]|nr:transporter substrate-binding domain-containing protein [Clostridia bacterium]
MKKIIALLTAVLLILSFAACGNKQAVQDDAESDLAYITDKGKIVVGITDYEPMDYKDKDGNWTGFDAEFAVAVAEKLGVEAEFIEIDWDNKALELDAKSIDCVWNGMTLTEEVQNSMECSVPYVENAQVVVMAADKVDSYKDINSMKDLKFSAEAGSAGESAVKDNGLDGKYTAVATQTNALMEVASGSADACVIDITMANAMTGEGTSYANLKSGIALTSEKYVIGFRKGSDAAVKVNEIIAEMMKDGTLDKLAEKYNLTLAK